MTDRYAHSKVYKLVDDTGYYYFGSTCMPLHKRLHEHKSKSNRAKDRKIYSVFTTERFERNEIKIILVEEFQLENKEQLIKEENKYIEVSINDPFCLNSFHAIKNIEQMKERCKIYRDNNKEKYREYEKIRSETRERLIVKNTCACGSVYIKDHKKRHELTKKHIKFLEVQK